MKSRGAGSEMLWLILIMLVLPLAARAAEPGITTVSRRLFSLIGGMGNAMGGGLGAQFEFYFLEDRFSGFAGVGHVFDGENGEPGGFGNVIGTRVFAGTEKDRAFLGLSLATLTFEYPRGGGDALGYPERRYGPVLALGFQHAGLGGFTFMLSGGVGYLSGRDPLYIDRWTPRFSFGLGHTWR